MPDLDAHQRHAYGNTGCQQGFTLNAISMLSSYKTGAFSPKTFSKSRCMKEVKQVFESWMEMECWMFSFCWLYTPALKCEEMKGDMQCWSVWLWDSPGGWPQQLQLTSDPPCWTEALFIQATERNVRLFVWPETTRLKSEYARVNILHEEKVLHL